MNISIDYDDTYTRDPQLWNEFATDALARGHRVYCVTMRLPSQGLEVVKSIGAVIGPENVFFTSMQAKKAYMYSKGIDINVWIDDMPDAILRGVEIVNDGKIYD